MKNTDKFLTGILSTSCLTLTLLAQSDPMAAKTPDNSEDTRDVPALRQPAVPRDSDAESTSGNSLDKETQTKTVLDQGTSQTDMHTTQQIRQKIMAIKGLSVDGQNVLIITNNGQVVLRGSVASENEQKRICKIANQVAGSKNVEDQLEVKVNTAKS